MTRKLTLDQFEYDADLFDPAAYVAVRGLSKRFLRKILGEGKTRVEVMGLEIPFTHRVWLLLHPFLTPLEQTRSFACDCAERTIRRVSLNEHALDVLEHARGFLEGRVERAVLMSVQRGLKEALMRRRNVYPDSFAAVHAALTVSSTVAGNAYYFALRTVDAVTYVGDSQAERKWQFNRLQEYPGFTSNVTRGRYQREEQIFGTMVEKCPYEKQVFRTLNVGLEPLDFKTEKKPVHETNDTNETCYFCGKSTEVLLGQSRYCPQCKK